MFDWLVKRFRLQPDEPSKVSNRYVVEAMHTSGNVIHLSRDNYKEYVSWIHLLPMDASVSLTL